MPDAGCTALCTALSTQVEQYQVVVPFEDQFCYLVRARVQPLATLVTVHTHADVGRT